MPDGVTLPPPDAPTSFPPGAGFLLPALRGNSSSSSSSSDNSSTAGLWTADHEEGILSGGYPWVPALLVGCSMVVFLSLSFYSHHRRVRRKRQILMDYLSVLLTTRAGSRSRSVSILCNTNSLGLSQLGKSFKITRPGKRKGRGDLPADDLSSSDFLRDRYLVDLVEFSNACKSKSVLKRFVSAPSEHKFRRVASQLMTLNIATRPGGGSVRSLGRNMSMPEDFDPRAVDFTSSLSEASTSITQGVLLDPNKMQRKDSGGTSPFTRSSTTHESSSEHSYENVAFADQVDVFEDSCSVKPAHTNTSYAHYDYSASSVENPRTSKLYLSDTARRRSMWFLNKSAVSPSCIQTDPRMCRERWDLNSTRPAFPIVSVTGNSVLPPYVPSLGMSCYSSRNIDTSGRNRFLHNGPFIPDCKEQHYHHHEDMLGQYRAMPPAARSFERDCYYHPHPRGTMNEMHGHVSSERPSGVGEACAEYDITSCPMQENGISVGLDILTDHDKTTGFQDGSFHRDEVHFKNLHQMGRQQSFQFCHSQNRQFLDCCKGLDGVKGTSRWPPTPQRTNSRDYSPMFPGENHPNFIPHCPTACHPAAFGCQHLAEGQNITQGESRLSSAVVQKGGEDSVINPVVPSRENPFTSRVMWSKPHCHIPDNFHHLRTRSKRLMYKTTSIQSTRNLISGTFSPSQSLSSTNSELPPPTQSAETTPAACNKASHDHDSVVFDTAPNPDNPGNIAPDKSFNSSNHDNIVSNRNTNHSDLENTASDRYSNPDKADSTASDRPSVDFFFHKGVTTGGPSLQTDTGVTYSSHSPPSASQPVVLTNWQAPSSDGSRERTEDSHRDRSDNLISLDILSSSSDSWLSMHHMSSVHRLPRFQAWRSGMGKRSEVDEQSGMDHHSSLDQRSSMDQHRKIVAQQGTVPEEKDSTKEAHRLEMDHSQNTGPQWTRGPQDTQI